MKKLSIILLIVIGTSLSVSAQNFRINGYTSYVFDDAIDSYYSETRFFEGQVNGGFQWGLGIEYMLPTNGAKQYGVELSYFRQDTKAPLTYYDPNDIVDHIDKTNFDLGLNFIMLGGNGYVKVNPKVEPFGGFAAGVAILDLTNPNNKKSDSATKFAWSIKGGANIYVTPKVALKLQASLLSSVQAVGGGLYFGTGGAGAGVSSYSSMLQLILGGGLTLNLN
ncbi:porin family protein [Solitalea sp. MAHUQ-68]|uniref:Porin family protein n=1 Tax=Solitalea agri TaxID=2953739 RepID=A0A9X2F1J6_9SPHI|nr:outer membrane beta-barrel protein [Solitalea agri]MCO4292455.1 porin family protein [Solitalea agri]